MISNIIRFSFIFVSLILCVMLGFMAIDLLKKKNVYKAAIACPVFVGIYSILAYCVFLLAQNHRQAVFFDSLYFVGTDWLAMFMFMFSISYTEITVKYKNKFLLFFSALCGLDSINLLINNFTLHMFDLVQMQGKSGVIFWGNAFKWPHYVHLGLCYVMVAATLVYFIISTIKVPVVYKNKYLGILLAYIVIIIANFVSYSLNLPVDFSVILYGVLAALIYYFATYAFPHKLLNLSLKFVNENISDAIICYDIRGNCIYANNVAHRLFTKNGKFSVEEAEIYREKWLTTLGIENETFVVDRENFIIDGKEYHYSIEFQKEFFEGKEVGSCMKLVDRTAETENYLKELYLATHDELTGIYNRVGFFEAVDGLLEKGINEEYLMLASNIKDFKLINELFGDRLGDEVIQKQAIMFKANSKPDSIYGRIGDDKFALFIKKKDFSEAEFKEYVESMHKLTESSIYQMHIFIGIYELQGRIESAQNMYDKAVMAISEISDNYMKTFSYYDSTLMEKLLNEKNIVEDFQQAIAKQQIKMVLQPIIDSDKNLFGAEALCRWQHPLRGLLLPADFLSILEKAGLIYQLDEYIWNQAAEKLHEWSVKGCNNCYISVNVSVKDFFYTDIYKTFTTLVSKYDIAPSSLHIEITEDVLMSDFAKAFTLATKLKKSGFIVAIDNFGNGHSSLNMLKDFEADILKIDMSLISKASSDERTKIILQAILNMAELLKIPVVGEGVENKDQYEILRSNNCHIHQGNYLSHPMSVEDFEDRFVKYFFNN